MIKLHIFDVDGTILDSMRMWDNIIIDYLENAGYSPSRDLVDILDPLTFAQTVEYVAKEFDIPGGTEAVREGIYSRLLDHYTNDLVMFDGMKEELDEVASQGIPMVVLSNSLTDWLRPALERNGILHLFQRIYTTEMLGMKKDSPEIFRKVCELMGVDPSEAMVYEDSPFAVEAAKQAGCIVKEYDKYR
jgi:HAD superfamily hydrolase (TIGR01509 family)